MKKNKCLLLVLFSVITVHPYFPRTAVAQEDKTASRYLVSNGKALNQKAKLCLHSYLSDQKKWKPFPKSLDIIARNNNIRIIAFGDSHGRAYTEISAAETMALQILHKHGFSTLFLEVLSDNQKYLNAFVAGNLGYDELAQRVEEVNGNYSAAVMETAKHFGFRLIAMDRLQTGTGEERDSWMFKIVNSHLRGYPAERVVVFAGAHHIARDWYDNPALHPPLAKLLRMSYGTQIVTIHILTRSNTKDFVYPYHNHSMPGMIIRTNPSPITDIPFWVAAFPHWEHLMRYGDWDYLLTSLEK